MTREKRLKHSRESLQIWIISYLYPILILNFILETDESDNCIGAALIADEEMPNSILKSSNDRSRKELRYKPERAIGHCKIPRTFQTVLIRKRIHNKNGSPTTQSDQSQSQTFDKTWEMVK